MQKQETESHPPTHKSPANLPKVRVAHHLRGPGAENPGLFFSAEGSGSQMPRCYIHLWPKDITYEKKM